MSYDRFEISKVVEFYFGGIECCKPVDDNYRPKSGESCFWSVYGHNVGIGIDSIADFKKKRDADYICKVLNKGIGK